MRPTTRPSTRSVRALLPILALLALALAGCSSPAPGEDGVTGVAPAWSFVDTEGREHTDEDARGNASVLFFMATWCSSCRALTPKLAALHRDHAEEGLQLYSITVERGDDDAKLEDWKGRFQQPWPHGRDPSWEMPRTFEIVAQSSVVVLDDEGRVVRKWGYPGPSEEALRAAVQEAMAAPGAA